ncbi:MAG: NapC/NirT family cytochrome c [Pseudomonadota bacterium]
MDNNTDDAPHAERKGLIGRLWQTIRRPSAVYSLGSLIAIGGVGGVLFWGGFNWGMEATNTERFCIGCHEMYENVYVEYKETAHYNNHSGVRAVCSDCHVPKEWVFKVRRKIVASRELFHHFAGSINTPEKFDEKRLKLASNVWKAMKETDSRECRNCHNFEYMDFTLQEDRSGIAHQQAIDANMTCIDCHQGIAHNLPAGAEDAYRQISAEFEAENPDKAAKAHKGVDFTIFDRLAAFATKVAD